MSLLVSAAASFRPPLPSRAIMPRAGYHLTAVTMNEEKLPPSKITIRKRKDLTADELMAKLRASRSSSEAAADSEGSATSLGNANSDGDVFLRIGFSHVKKSLGTLLKFWLMGGCGAKGWAGTGELEAKHTSGTQASIEVCEEHATVTLLSSSEPSHNKQRQLGRYAEALLDELEGLASTEEAAPADRLCYPPEAVEAARASLSTAPAE